MKYSLLMSRLSVARYRLEDVGLRICAFVPIPLRKHRMLAYRPIPESRAFVQRLIAQASVTRRSWLDTVLVALAYRRIAAIVASLEKQGAAYICQPICAYADSGEALFIILATLRHSARRCGFSERTGLYYSGLHTWKHVSEFPGNGE